jgi:diguanylate cyclase (GGDEF)-like protein
MAAAADTLAARLPGEFARALRDGQIVGHFQPEIELSTGQLVAAELLARWEHPELGTLLPATFLHLAERLGLMRELTLVMLRQALAQHRAWAADGWVVRMSVNIGPSLVADPEFPITVARLLREYQVSGEMLVLEVSEETGTANASSWFFAELGDFGVQVALDDFGTGFASLESLGGWPINELKLDRSLVRPITGSTSFRTIVRTTIDLAHQLGVKVVAEGVESAAHSSELRALGCDIGQGYFLGRPMSAATFTEWMRDPVRTVLRFAVPEPPQPGPLVSKVEQSWLARGIGGRAIRAVSRAAAPFGRGTLAALIAFLVVYGLWQVFRWGGREHQALIGDLAFIPVNTAAAVFSWRVSRRTDLARYITRPWMLIALALALYMLGDLLQFVYENVLHERAYPTWADACYLSFYVIAAYALLSTRGQKKSASEHLRRVLDMGTVFMGGAVLIWAVALAPAVTTENDGHGFDLVNLVTYAYPVGDMLLLFGTLSVLWWGVSSTRSVLSVRLFTLGVLLFIAADMTYDWITVHSSYLGGDPVDTLWMLALTCLCLSAASRLHSEAPRAPLPPPAAPVAAAAAARPSFLPYVAVGSSFVLLAAAGLPTVPFAPLGGIMIAAVLLTFMVTTRQYVALRDYRRLAARYQELAAVDGMTGLFNRRHFMERAEAAFAQAQRAGQPFAVLMIDVNKFKEINDTHGHIAGDQVLAELAQVCRDNTRPDDIVGRYGGDEFTITVPGISSLRAIQLAEQLTHPISRVLGRDGKTLDYTVSVGIAESAPENDLGLLLMHADVAMYEAKQAGGGWRIYGDGARPVPPVIPSPAAAPGVSGVN